MKKTAFHAVPVTAGGLLAVGCMVAMATASPPVNTPSPESGKTLVGEQTAVEDGLPINASEEYRPGPSLTTTPGSGVAMAAGGGLNILVYDNNTMHNLAQIAANNISSSVTVADATTFNGLLVAGGWDIVAVDCPSSKPAGGWGDLAVYVDGGGCAVMAYWDWDADGPNAAFDVSVSSTISLDFATLESSGTPEAGAVFSGVTMPNSDWHGHWGDDGDEFNALGGAVALAHIGDPAHPTMVLGNGGATIASQVIDEAGDTWLGDGSGVTLWENMMLQLECAGGPPPGDRVLTGLSSTNPGNLYNISKATGEATFVCSLNGGASFTGLAWLDDVLYGSDLYDFPGSVSDWDTGSIDTAACEITFVSDQGTSSDWHGLAAANGLLYSMDVFDTVLKELDPGTGAVTTIGGGTGIDGRGMAYVPSEGTMYAISGIDDSLYTINLTTGTASLVGPLGVLTDFRPGLAYCADNDTLYLNVGGAGDTLYTVDRSTGTASLVGPNGGDFDIDGLGWRGEAPPPGVRTLTGLSSENPANLYDISKETGEATFICSLNGGASFTGLAWLDDVLYGSDLFDFPGTVSPWDTGSIDTTTCDITFVSDQDGSSNWHGLASANGLLWIIDNEDLSLKTLSPGGTVNTIGISGIEGRGMAHVPGEGLYAVSFDDALYTVDMGTGAATLVGPLGVPTFFLPGLAYCADNDTLYLNIGGSVGTLHTVDRSTGLATLVGPNGATAIDGLAWLQPEAPDGCPWDLDETGSVGFSDLLSVLAAWGPCPGCPEDFDGNDVVGFSDLLKLLANWGPCPGPPPLPVPPPAGSTNVIR